MDPLDQVRALLLKALHEPLTRKETIGQLQTAVWDRSFPTSHVAYDIVADLAHDLDFFEPDPVVRNQDVTYYGDERLKKEIETALRRLAELAAKAPS